MYTHISDSADISDTDGVLSVSVCALKVDIVLIKTGPGVELFVHVVDT